MLAHTCRSIFLAEALLKSKKRAHTWEGADVDDDDESTFHTELHDKLHARERFFERSTVSQQSFLGVRS